VIHKISGSNLGPDFGEGDNPSRDAFKTKADLVKFVQEAVANGAKVIQQQGDTGLDNTTNFFGNRLVHNSYIWTFAIEHSGEHYGQLVVYYRANNLVVGNASRKPLPQSLNGRFAHDSARNSRHMRSDDGQILRNLRSPPMTAADFRRIALSLEGVEEYSHAGLPAFRVGGRKFASLASQAGGYGNLMLTLEQQAAFVEEAPEIFLPIPGGWGKMGHTHIRLAAAREDVLTDAVRTAWRLRIDKNANTSRTTPHVAERSGVTDKKRGKRRL